MIKALSGVGILVVLSGWVAAARADNCQPPRVLIVLDKSSSMVTGNDSNGVTKWASATAAVETLVSDYGDQIDFGLMVFPYPNLCSAGQVVVDVGPNTAGSIGSFLGSPPPTSGNYTPMSQSLDVVATYAPLLDPATDTYVLLVTDGWQWCDPYDASTRFDAVDSVQALHGLGIETFVLGFGDGVDVLNNNYMAEAGGHALPNCNPSVDDPHASNLCYHQTGNQAELEAAFDAIALELTGETCDGLDNDCDGFTDNAVPHSPDPLTRQESDSCGTCLSACVNGNWQGCSAQGPCDDGVACTVDDWCSNNVCQGTPIGCDDGDPCTDDSCGPQGCVHTYNNDWCDDGNLCTAADRCQNGTCLGTPVVCDDGNACTDDTCHPVLGCRYEPNDDPCDDGDSCTYNDHCQGAKCAGTPVDCGDGDVCTDDVCDPAQGCRNDYNDDRCDDGDPCTANDRCAMGTCAGTPFDCGNTDICEHENCDDGNACTDDSCQPNFGCVYQNNFLPCDDGDPCTENDHCQNGGCQGTPFDCNPVDHCQGVTCDDGNPCTDDSCDPASGCVFSDNHAACDDGDPCTENDQCQNGGCQGAPLDCDDGNPCTADYCDANPCTGDTCTYNDCVHVVLEGPCDDRDMCTQGDTCINGTCVAGDDMCSPREVGPSPKTGCSCGAGDTHGPLGCMLVLFMLAVLTRRQDL